MSDEEKKPIDNKTMTEKFEEYYNLAISQLEELVENFELEYEKNQNPEAKIYAEDIRKCIEEIKETTEKENISLEKEKIFADYVEELIERYSNYYLTILAIETILEMSEKDPKELEKMPKWEEIIYDNSINSYNPISNMENISNDEIENNDMNDLNNPEVLAYYNQFLSNLEKEAKQPEKEKQEEQAPEKSKND